MLMKKILLLIVLVFVFSLMSCSDKGEENALSQKERVEKIAEIKKAYSPGYDSPATIEISGNVSTFDGKFPDGWYIRTVSGNTHSSIGGSGGCDPDAAPKNTFKGKIYPGKSYLMAICEGYAPFFMELDLEEGDFLHGIEVVFDHGFDSKIKVVDEDGEVISGAVVKGSFGLGNYTFGNAIEAKTGEDGIVVCENLADLPVSLKVVASGYQAVEGYKVELKPYEVYTIVLNKTKPANGVVVSSKTGEPVANAEFRFVSKDKPGHSWGYGTRGEAVAVSDEDGAFVLDTLEAGASYTIMISSPDHRAAFVSGVTAGKGDMKIEMDPAAVVNAKITGDISKIRKGWYTVDGESAKGPSIQVNCILKKVRGIYNDLEYYPVTIKDGVGYVEIKNAMGSRLEFVIDGKTVHKLDIVDGKSQYDITFDTEVQAEPEREVLVKFSAGEGMPLPEGKIWASGRKDGESKWFSRHAKVIDGEAKFKVPVPCEIDIATGRQDKLIGYWFNRVKKIEVNDSDEVFEYEVKVRPGGSIFGDIYDADGKKVSANLISIEMVNEHEMKKSDVGIEGHVSDLMDHEAGRSGSYSAMPLPFGGKYKFQAVHENYVMLSPVIKITEKKPIVRYDFKKDKSIDLKGQILRHDGTVSTGVEYQLYRSDEIISGSLGRLKRVDENGIFVIEGVNPDVEVDYSLRVFDKETAREERIELKAASKSQEVKLSKPVVIRGRVVNSDTGEGIVGLLVSATAQIEGKYTDLKGTSISDEDGNFEISVPVGDRYYVRVDDQSLRAYYGESLSAGGSYYTRIDSVDEEVLFEVRPPNTLSGQVVDRDTDEPIAGVKISGVLWINENSKNISGQYSPVTDSDGRFRFESFEGVAYEIKYVEGYKVYSNKRIEFSKGNRNRDVVIKVYK